MRTLIRTIAIYITAFIVAQALPKEAILIPIISLIAVSAATLDFLLYLSSGKGLIDHLQNS